jgi:hypothetical protein
MVRECRYAITAPGFRTQEITLVTTLVDPISFPQESLSDIYLIRWRIEVNFRDLKTTMGLDILKCKTVDGIMKELSIFAMIYNMVMSVRFRASRLFEVAADRISFIDILRQIRLNGLVVPVTILVNPYRPGRWAPRVIKRRPKPYPLMIKPRKEYAIGDDKKA